MARAILTAIVAVAGMVCGCVHGAPANEHLGGQDAAANVNVGPSPLRRLSDDEYLNALHDLFPALSPTLPALPPDIPVAGFDNAAEAQVPSDVLIARFEVIANLYAAAATADPASVSALV